MLNKKTLPHIVLYIPLLILFSALVILSSGTAVACTTGACIQVGPRLTSLDTQQSALLNPLLSGLLGTDIALDVMDWQALSGGDINLLSYLNALESDLAVSGTDQVLFADASLLQLLNAARNVAQSDGNNDLANALGLLPVAAITDTIKLVDLLKLDLQDDMLADTDLNALNLVTGLIQLYNYENVLATPAPVTLDGSALSTLGLGNSVGGVELYLQVVEPPIYTCGPVGTTFHTAAIRSKLNVDLINLSPDSAPLVSAVTDQLSGLLGLNVTADIQLANFELYLEVARAEGTITAIDALLGTITVEATPGLVDLYLGSIDDSIFFNRDHIIDPDNDVLPGEIGTLDLQIKQSLVLSEITLANIQTNILARAVAQGEAPFTQSLVFSGPHPQTQTITSSANFVDTLLEDLVNNLELSFSSNLGLLDALISGLLDVVTGELSIIVNDILSPVLSTVLTQLIDPLLGLLGISIGEADVTVLSTSGNCDYGDCPIYYGSAAHQLSADLHLGALAPDADNTMQAGMTAEGDGVDEDGVLSLAPLTTSDTSYSTDVIVANNTGETATLIAWIDFDRNNRFDADEAAIYSIPTQASTRSTLTGISGVSVNLNWPNIPAGTQAGESFLRLRLTTGDVTAEQPDGYVSDGEVEDFPLTILTSGVTVSGRVFLDANVNASSDNDESGISNLSVVLYDAVNDQCVSGLTDAEGYYQFDGVQAGSYQVYEAALETVPTPRNCGTEFAKNPAGYLSTTDDVSPVFSVANSDMSGPDFGEIKPPTFAPNHSGQVLAGNVIFYAHRFATPAKGLLTLTDAFSNSTSSDWSSLLYPDNNCDGQLNGTDAAVSMSGSRVNRLIWESDSISLEADEYVCFINKVYAPSNVVANEQYQQIITATIDYSNTFAGLQVLTVQDLTTATHEQIPATNATTPASGPSRLQLRKTVRNVTQTGSETEGNNEASPGDILEYRIYYSNTGAGPVSDLKINDSVPDFTELVANSVICEVTPLDMICSPGDIVVGVDSLYWGFTGSLEGGLQGFVSFQVRVDG